MRSLAISPSALDLGDGGADVAPVVPADEAFDGTLAERTDAFQRELVVRALQRNRGNQSAAARDLGLDRSNFHRLKRRLFVGNACE